MPFNTACQLDKEGRTLLPECLVNCFIVAQIGENAYSCILLIQTINVCFDNLAVLLFLKSTVLQ